MDWKNIKEQQPIATESGDWAAIDSSMDSPLSGKGPDISTLANERFAEDAKTISDLRETNRILLNFVRNEEFQTTVLLEFLRGEIRPSVITEVMDQLKKEIDDYAMSYATAGPGEDSKTQREVSDEVHATLMEFPYLYKGRWKNTNGVTISKLVELEYNLTFNRNNQ